MKQLIIAAFLLLSSWPLAAQTATYVPSEAIRQARQQFRDSRLGVFIHWGIYSMLADGEWVMNNKSINYEEYPHLADGFYPSRFDADEWVSAIKAAGAKYITITTRHHDGFSMFATKQDRYNIVDGTPYHRDILKELAEACRRHGVRLHLYYSHLDWHRTDYPLGRTGRKLGRPTNRQDYDSYFRFMSAQLTELLTNYGPIGAIWFDGWWDHDSDATPFDWRLDEQYRLIHGLQPACLVGNNHHQTPYPGEDIQIFEQDVPGENAYGLSGQSISRLPLETCMTMNNTWGYSITDKNYKSSDDIIRQIVKCAGIDANMLINIGPRPDGQLPAEAMARLKDIGAWMAQNGQTICGTRGGLVAPRDWGVTTQRGNTLYVHILNWKDRGFFLPLAGRRAVAACMFRGPGIAFKATADGVSLTLPEAPHGVDTIVEVTLR